MAPINTGSGKQDPTLRLDDFLLASVFSFLGDKTTAKSVTTDPRIPIVTCIPGLVNQNGERRNHGQLGVRDAAQLQTALASVCQRWRQVCERYLKDIVGILTADITRRHKTNMKPWLDVPCIDWMCRYHLPIGSLRCVLWLNDQDTFLLQKLFQECDTCQLKSLWISFAIDFWRNSGREHHLQLQGMVYNTIAKQCPHLEEASIACRLSIWLAGEGVDPYEPLKAFFSIPSLRRLRWTVDCYEHTNAALRARIGPAIVTKLISGLPALERLELRGEAGCFLDQCLPIESQSLQVLDLSQLAVDNLGLLCCCPRLVHIDRPRRDVPIIQHFDSKEAFEYTVEDLIYFIRQHSG